MPEGQSLQEVEPNKTLASEVRGVFERRALAGDRKLIYDTYQKKLDALIQTMPSEERNNVAIKVQEVVTQVRGFVSEYGARFFDFVRNIVLWPMIQADKDFPKDKYYQLSLASAKAWGEFGWDTTKTATAERKAYRDHFLASAVTKGELGALAGGAGGLLIGAIEGAKIGAVTLGVGGALAGAAVGGAIGGVYSLGLYFKDKIMGPPVVFYDLQGMEATAVANANAAGKLVGGLPFVGGAIAHPGLLA